MTKTHCDSNHKARKGSAGAEREENAKIGFKSPDFFWSSDDWDLDSESGDYDDILSMQMSSAPSGSRHRICFFYCLISSRALQVISYTSLMPFHRAEN